MQDVNVVVVFYSRTGRTEQLALAAAVGAVQGRANIRLRRLPDAADEATIASVPEWKENRDRMNKEYVAPRETDIAWADAIVVGVPQDESPAPDFTGYAGKIGAAFHDGPQADALCEAMRAAGLSVLAGTARDSDPVAAARNQGRRLAEAARARKTLR